MGTVLEIDAKKTNLEAEIATALEAAKVLTPATTEFDDAYGRYLAAKANLAKIPDEMVKARQSENADAIKVCVTQVAEAIGQLVDGLKLADLLGTPVIALRYAKPAEGEAIVVFNPIAQVAGTSKKTAGTKGAGRTVIVDPEGNRLSLTKFVLNSATDAEKDSTNEAFLKYPHAAVDTKPKFEVFCEAHSLTGYTYETPQAGGEAAEAS